jgi:hypothetical protein
MRPTSPAEDDWRSDVGELVTKSLNQTGSWQSAEGRGQPDETALGICAAKGT